MEITPGSGFGVPVLDRLGIILSEADAATGADWHALGDAQIEHALLALELTARRLEHMQANIVAVAEAKGTWAASGSRSINTWLRELTGSSKAAASASVRLSRALKQDLLESDKALAGGEIGREHVQILQREAMRTTRLREQLRDPQMGEEFLLQIGRKLSVDDFRKTVRHWATLADPEAADRNWREESENEEVFLSAVGDMYYLSGKLNKVSGRALEVALAAQMGRKSEDDSRTPAQRRAAALTSWAHSYLDSGALKPGSRIRPHLSVHVPFETLQGLCEATGSSVPPPRMLGGGPSTFESLRAPGGPKEELGSAGGSGAVDPVQWVDSWADGQDHVISTALDYTKLQGLAPATLDDGTAIPPRVLSRIACGSSLTRVVFGPASTIIDVGREQRIFPANQTKGIIARDRHCQYPGCTEPPEYGEIHHSLWWWKHNGKTSTDQGILLCWHHHAYVHEFDISIARFDGSWVFTTENGAVIQPVGERVREGLAREAGHREDSGGPPGFGEAGPPGFGEAGLPAGGRLAGFGEGESPDFGGPPEPDAPPG